MGGKSHNRVIKLKQNVLLIRHHNVFNCFLEIAENCSRVEIKRDGQLKSNNRLSGLLMNRGKYPSMSIFTINNKDSALAILLLSPRCICNPKELKPHNSQKKPNKKANAQTVH